MNLKDSDYDKENKVKRHFKSNDETVKDADIEDTDQTNKNETEEDDEAHGDDTENRSRWKGSSV